jgi:hypothetical protein
MATSTAGEHKPRYVNKPAWAVCALLMLLLLTGVAQVVAADHDAPGAGARHLAGEGGNFIFLAGFCYIVGLAGYGLCLCKRRLPLEEEVGQVHKEMGEVREEVGIVHDGIDRMLGHLTAVTPDAGPEPERHLAMVVPMPRHRAPRPQRRMRAH